MDITSLSNDILKHLVLEFRNNDKPGLPFEEIQNAFQGVSDTDLIKAISILTSKRYVKPFEADNIPYFVTLNQFGINAVE